MARLGGHHLNAGAVALFAAESLVLAAAARVGWAAFVPSHGGALGPAVAAVGCVATVQYAFYWADLYDVRVAAADRGSGRRLLLALGLITLAAIPLALLLPREARAGVPAALAATAIGAAGVRALAPWRGWSQRVIVVGTGDAMRALLAELKECPQDEIVAVMDPRAGDLGARVRALRPDAVVVACDDRRGLPIDTLLDARLEGIEVWDAVAYVERARRKVPVSLLRPSALAFDESFVRSRLADAGRRTLSLLVASIIGLIFAPVLAAVALAIKLDSDGPVLYRQVRVGKGGRTFSMWKFRTMRADAEAATGAVWAQAGDPRVTRVGALLRRTRLDELPQIWNILVGDMDLVGPRPERPEFVERLKHQIPFYELRLLVRPGLAGWAQIRYPYGASVDDAREKLGFDLYYVKHATPLLDLIVLFHTAKVVVTGRGAR